MRTIIAILIVQIVVYLGCASFTGHIIAYHWTVEQQKTYFGIAFIAGVVTALFMEDKK